MECKYNHLLDIQHIPGTTCFTCISESCFQLSARSLCYLSNLTKVTQLRNSRCEVKPDSRSTFHLQTLASRKVPMTQPSSQHRDPIGSTLQNGHAQPVLRHGGSAWPTLLLLSPSNHTCWSHLSLRASSSCFLRASTSSIFLAVVFFFAFSASRSSLACRIHSHVSSGAASHLACSMEPRAL